MAGCPKCFQPLSEGARFCPGCGAEISLTSLPTMSEGADAPGISASPLEVSGPGSDADGRFLFGSNLGGRYRIVQLLGRGGMGEVYRADDLKLGQPVALKLLPREWASDSNRVERLYREVSIARQISHPNVCRVYDIGEVEGLQYLSMEYIDGENLAVLQSRIGRFSPDKATEIGRQICAGLHAAHEKGVIHRDLKPANIMIDGLGRARVTDFGLAAMAVKIVGNESRAGTPVYMAPEQLKGEEASRRSDIYALGLVLYELYSGQRTFRVSSVRKLLQAQSAPPSLSRVVEGLPPRAERVVMRCLAQDPAIRPESALDVSAELPGGDPLKDALAAGETPSPKVVAAAGAGRCLGPRAALLCLILFLVGTVAFSFATRHSVMLNRVPLESPPEVLQDRAKTILRDLGYTEAPVDSGRMFLPQNGFLRYTAVHDQSPQRWAVADTGQPAVIALEYRESLFPMQPSNLRGVLEPRDPPLTRPGMINIRVDTLGRLLSLRVVPMVQAPVGPEQGTDWSGLLGHAGLDAARLEPVKSEWVPPHFADERATFSGSYSEVPDLEIQVRAASLGGKPVFFEIVHPWTQPGGRRGPRVSLPARSLSLAILIFLFGGALWLARFNLKRGLGDRNGASRVAAFVFLGQMVSGLLRAHVWPGSGGSFRGMGFLLFALPLAFGVWVVYVALEPYVRKLWPQVLISWSRILSGQIRDPLVGRDILLGAVFGLTVVTLGALADFSHVWRGLPPMPPSNSPRQLSSLDGPATVLSGLIDGMTLVAPAPPLFLLGLIVLFRFLFASIAPLRSWATPLAVSCVGVVLIVQTALFQPATSLIPFLVDCLTLGGLLYVLLRLGLLAAMATSGFQFVLLQGSTSFDFSSWHATLLAVPLAVAAGIAILSFYWSLGEQSLWGPDPLQDETGHVRTF